MNNIIFIDYYTNTNYINDLYNYHNYLYNLYKNDKNILMYFYILNNKINGIYIFQKIFKVCKIIAIEMYTYDKEFIYFIGNYLLDNYDKFIFYNINQKYLLKLYNLIFKYEKLIIYNINKILIHNFDNITSDKEDIYIFDKNDIFIEKYTCNCIC